MGCDIHICIQVQDPDGSWREVPYVREPWGAREAPAAEWARQRWARVDAAASRGDAVLPSCFASRCYDLFGILADVRNGSGFAGCVTGTGWKSIAAGRGWPEGFDASTLVPDDEGVPRYMGDHSYTWVSLEELLAFDWDGEHAQLYGVVPADEYERLKESGEAPTSYSGGISGPGIKTYTPEDYEAAKRAGGRALAERPHVRMRWIETARQATGDWPGKVLPKLHAMAAGRPLRLVLGFDS